MLKSLKASLKWWILGATLFFLIKTLEEHWQGVVALRLSPAGVGLLAAALGVTLGAHVWSGWVWGRILRGVVPRPERAGAEVGGGWAIAVYLRTNIAKYLPGNIWHFYGRVQACQTLGISTAAALLSLVLESLLMAAAALALAGLSYGISWLQGLGLVAILLGIHPRLLNPVMQRLAKGKLSKLNRLRPRRGLVQETASSPKTSPETASPERVSSKMTSLETGFPVGLQRYPLGALLGEILFVGLRGAGFLLALRSLTPLDAAQAATALGAFSLAWVLGLIIPGAPGGIGVFEATAVGLLQGVLAPELTLGAVAGYRLISTLAEALGALAPPAKPAFPPRT